MKLQLICLFILLLTGCQRLVMAHTSRGDMDLVAYRALIDEVDAELRDEGLVDGAKIQIDHDHCVYTYHPAPPNTAAHLREEIFRRYEQRQRTSNFTIEDIGYTYSLIAGVRVREPDEAKAH